MAEVLDYIRNLRAAGHAVIRIGRRMRDAFAVCDRVAPLRRGEKVADKPMTASSPEGVTGLVTGAIRRV